LYAAVCWPDIVIHFAIPAQAGIRIKKAIKASLQTPLDPCGIEVAGSSRIYKVLAEQAAERLTFNFHFYVKILILAFQRRG